MEKRTKVVEEYKSVQEKSRQITEILESSELPEQISNSRDYRQLVDYLVKNHGVRIPLFPIKMEERIDLEMLIVSFFSLKWSRLTQFTTMPSCTTSVEIMQLHLSI